MNTPFSGVVLTTGEGQEPLELSPFSKTEWDNDVATIPSFNPHTVSKNQWDNDDSSENQNVFAFVITKDEWQ